MSYHVEDRKGRRYATHCPDLDTAEAACERILEQYPDVRVVRIIETTKEATWFVKELERQP